MKKIYFILISITIWCACSDDKQGMPEISGVTFSEFRDERDQSVYRCITIDGQTWMAENLHYRLPWGSYGGCYSYMEKQADTTDFYASGTKFAKRIIEALEKGEVIDPDGKMKTYIKHVNSGMWEVVTYNERFNAFPEVYAYLEKVREELEMESISIIAVDFLAEAEKKNGGYKDKYGFLYTYEAAKTALPQGWRLPNDEDWKKLEKALGMSGGDCDRMEDYRGSAEGLALKDETEGVGFNVRMSGGKIYGAGGRTTTYQNCLASAYFWSSTITKMDDATDAAVIRKFQYNEDRIFRGTSKMGRVAYSIRGIKN